MEGALEAFIRGALVAFVGVTVGALVSRRNQARLTRQRSERQAAEEDEDSASSDPMHCPIPGCVGFVEKLRIHSTGEVIYVCDECDALWTRAEAMAPRRMEDYIGFMRSRRLSGLKTDIEWLTRAPAPQAPAPAFLVDRRELIDLIDEAWTRPHVPDPADRYVRHVDMGRVIGSRGETWIRLVVRTETSELIAAHPEFGPRLAVGERMRWVS